MFVRHKAHGVCGPFPKGTQDTQSTKLRNTNSQKTCVEDAAFYRNQVNFHSFHKAARFGLLVV